MAGSFGVAGPVRVLDTRVGLGARKAAVPAGMSVPVQVTGQAGIPATGVSAVVVNLTVTAPTTAGYLTAYPDGAARPNTSTLNFTPHQTVANLTVVPVGTDGEIRIHNGSANTVQLIADITGYYLAGTPELPTLEPSAAVLTGLSCPTRIFCVAVDSDGRAFTLTDNVWGAPVQVDTAINLQAVSCVDSGFCLAAGTKSDGSLMTVAAVYSHGHWATTGPTGLQGTVASVSCVSLDWCATLTPAGYFAVFDGAAWHPPVQVRDQRVSNPTALSCTSSTFCAMVDNAGYARLYDGHSWSALVSISTPMGSLSCATTTSCTATNSVGRAVNFNGTTWTVFRDTGRWAGAPPISCPTATFCGIASGRSLWTYDKPHFGQPVEIDADPEINDTIQALSCPDANYCVANTQNRILTWTR